jgi:hypothetical protein
MKHAEMENISRIHPETVLICSRCWYQLTIHISIFQPLVVYVLTTFANQLAVINLEAH